MMEAPARIDARGCTGCSQCRLICPAAAIRRAGSRCVVEANRCTRCGRCLWVCPGSHLAAALPPAAPGQHGG